MRFALRGAAIAEAAVSATSPHSPPLAIIAGNGLLPSLLASSVSASARSVVVLAIDGEADPGAFPPDATVHRIRWGEIGRLFRILSEAGCTEAVFIGGIGQRPDYRSILPDFGAVKLIPRIVQIMRNGDDRLLREVAAIFAERGVDLVSPLDVGADLVLPEGTLTSRVPGEDDRTNIARALRAALQIGELDIGQGAVAVGGRIVALEAAEGTDAMLLRVAELRSAGRIAKSGGVLVKCLKPQQDRRLDIPTIGPLTAEKAAAAGLAGVAGIAGTTLLAGRRETLSAFEKKGLFLIGLKATHADG